MTITTKFNIGDEVWYLYGKQSVDAKVCKIEITVFSDGPGIMYHTTGNYQPIEEPLLYSTKQSLLESLQ